ncbi:hypothetical protein F3Y22_tig00001728pilonHSYRG00084 [Hibiscus syriacus]|uniref:Uncharacterized protein n=1 Tax=Hibiscus syriacus TaxID=106335 RepID=A0A6A3CU59_HIBSY|nr:hypothetical protein F3Y22_tig00001728pilonHSYRG00084 [Hibiscus syriacus]
MGQKLSCIENHETALLSAVQTGDMEMVKAMVETDPSALKSATLWKVVCSSCGSHPWPDRDPIDVGCNAWETECVKRLIQSGSYEELAYIMLLTMVISIAFKLFFRQPIAVPLQILGALPDSLTYEMKVELHLCIWQLARDGPIVFMPS